MFVARLLSIIFLLVGDGIRAGLGQPPREQPPHRALPGSPLVYCGGTECHFLNPPPRMAGGVFRVQAAHHMFRDYEVALLIVISFTAGVFALCLAVLCCKQSIEHEGWRPCFSLWMRFFWALLSDPFKYLWRKMRPCFCCCLTRTNDTAPDLAERSNDDSLAVQVADLEPMGRNGPFSRPSSPEVAIPMLQMDYSSLTPLPRRSRFIRPYDWPRVDPPTYDEATSTALCEPNTCSPPAPSSPTTTPTAAPAYLPLSSLALTRSHSAPVLAVAEGDDQPQNAFALALEPVEGNPGYVRLADLLPEHPQLMFPPSEE